MSTDRDYADKSWLRGEPDAFSLVPPEVAGPLLLFALAVAMVGDAMGWWL